MSSQQNLSTESTSQVLPTSRVATPTHGDMLCRPEQASDCDTSQPDNGADQTMQGDIKSRAVNYFGKGAKYEYSETEHGNDGHIDAWALGGWKAGSLIGPTNPDGTFKPGRSFLFVEGDRKGDLFKIIDLGEVGRSLGDLGDRCGVLVWGGDLDDDDEAEDDGEAEVEVEVEAANGNDGTSGGTMEEGEADSYL